VSDDYSRVADDQRDAALEAGPDVGLYNAVLDAIELILDFPAQHN
jgi:hypothetical protein